MTRRRTPDETRWRVTCHDPCRARHPRGEDPGAGACGARPAAPGRLAGRARRRNGDAGSSRGRTRRSGAARGARRFVRCAGFGIVLLTASQLAIPVLGLLTALCLCAGALAYVAYARHLAPRTPFAILAASAAAGSFALGGWAVVASVVRPTPLLVAAVIFLWVPGYAWSLSLSLDRGAGAHGLHVFADTTGARMTA